MRTKSIILGAALLAAGALSSLAQSNVYSLNVVGYYTIPVTNGFQMVANQLDADGSGTNNTVVTVFGTNLPNLTKVYAYNSGTLAFVNATYLSGGNSWIGQTGAVNAVLQPGNGFFLQIPNAATNTSLTFAGTVLQGSLSTPLVLGANLVASQVPLSGGIRTTLGATPANLDAVYQFLPSTQGYGPKHTFLSSGSGSWLAGEPAPAVGEGVWFFSQTATNSWHTNFTVQ